MKTIDKVKPHFIFIFLFCLVGSRIIVSDLERTKVVINNQKFEIMTAYALFDTYMSRRIETDVVTASNQLIYDPIQKEILLNAEAPFMFETIRSPYQPNDLLKKEIELLKSSDLLGIVEKTLSTVSLALPGPETKIVIIPANPSMHDFFVKNDMCMNAVTVGSGKIIVMIDPTKIFWKKALPYIIAHEYHHSAWIAKHWRSSDFSLLEYLIFEGRADAFAENLYNDVKSPWTTMISNEQEKSVWKIITPKLSQKGSAEINKVMFGGQDIPFGSGYTIGLNIVRSFKKNNPKYSDIDIIDLKPEEILVMSNYR
jgi:uncharacterized protein YjaZ